MTPDLVVGLVLLGGLCVASAATLRGLLATPSWADRLADWLRGPGSEPGRRPIEDVARNVRRLAAAYHRPPPGQRHARFEGVRQAYDDALREACASLGVPDLLAGLPPGQERDAARLRVEYLLEEAGLVLREPH